MRFNYHTRYRDSFALLRHTDERVLYGLLLLALCVLPWVVTPFLLGELAYVFILCIASLGLMLLTGFTGETKEEAGSTFYENHVFSTGWIKMTPPLSDGQVTFADGAPNDVKHMSEDVAAFLMWTAEPKLMARKEAGFKAVLFLAVLASLLYLTNKRIWAAQKGKKTA